MYRAFDLKLNENMMEMDLARECSVYGKNLIDVSRSDIESILSDVFLNGTIDGSA